MESLVRRLEGQSDSQGETKLNGAVICAVAAPVELDSGTAERF